MLGANDGIVSVAAVVVGVAGATAQLAAILLLPVATRIPVTFGIVLIALAITGYVAAWIGGSHRGRAMLRVVVGGALALAATFAIGALLGTEIA